MARVSVHPLSLGPDHFGSPEVLCAFYSLGCLVSYAKTAYGGALRETFDFAPITPTMEREALDGVAARTGAPGVFLLSSYVWNHAANMTVAAAIKRHSPPSLVVVGGPHVPRAAEPARRFFGEHPYVDVAVRHEGEDTLAEVLRVIADTPGAPEDPRRADLSSIAGVTLRRDGTIVQTPDRPRRTDLAAFPSPYTSGEFDHWMDGRAYMPIETNRGCPYGCTFCDWGAATLSKVHRVSLERVLAEIDFAGRRRIHALGICDANFGILPRDVDIARHIAATRARYGFPREVHYSSAKTAHPRVIDVVKILRGAGFAAAAPISMQTTDERTLANVDRANIKTSEYRKTIAILHREGIPAISDMMLGLPGQTLATCQKDLQFFFDHKVLAIIFAASVMPNAPMAADDYRTRFGIAVDSDGMVESTYSFSREDYARMFELCLAYKLFVKLGLAKYLLYYLQLDQGVPAMDLLARWLTATARRPERLPLSARVRRELMAREYTRGSKDWLVLAWTDDQARFLFEGFEAFQRELLEFAAAEFGARQAGADVDAILAANRAVLPHTERRLPMRIPLAHDVPEYFARLRRLASVEAPAPDHWPLAAHGPGTLEIAAQPPCTSYRYMDVDLTGGTLELASNLRI